MARRYKDAPSILQDEKECFLGDALVRGVRKCITKAPLAEQKIKKMIDKC